MSNKYLGEEMTFFVSSDRYLKTLESVKRLYPNANVIKANVVIPTLTLEEKISLGLLEDIDNQEIDYNNIEENNLKKNFAA